MASQKIKISNIGDLVENLTKLDRRWIFRGHGDSNWRLLSTLERMFANWQAYHDVAEKMEEYALHRLESEADHYLGVHSLPDTRLGRLAFLQHHGVPTRLLDFTTSSFIALFFASVESFDDSSYFSVWAINYRNLIKHSLHKLREHSPESIPDYEELQLENQDDFFENHVMTSEQSCLWVTEPRRANRRLERQRGTFLLSSSFTRTIEDLIEDHAEDDVCLRIDVPTRLREEVQNLLRATALDNKRLFGDIDGFARDLKADLESIMRDYNEQLRELNENEIAESL